MPTDFKFLDMTCFIDNFDYVISFGTKKDLIWLDQVF